jgi:hypothetical protein
VALASVLVGEGRGQIRLAHTNRRERKTERARSRFVVEQAERVRASDGLELRVRVELLDDTTDVPSHRRVPDPDAFRDLTVRESGREECEGLALAAGQPPKQQRTPFANAFLFTPALGESKDVRDRLEELDMDSGESAPPNGVSAQHTESRAVAPDQDAEAALHAMLAKERGRVESGLFREVADHDGLVRLDRIAGVRFAAGPDGRATDEPGTPAHPRPKQERRTAGQQLQDRAELDAEVVRDQARRVREQLDRIGPRKRAVPKSGDRGLLLVAGTQLSSKGV